MATKKYDLAVKVSSYTDRNGESKNRYENIGAVFQGDNGPYLVLKRSFNPAGVPFKEGSDSIIVSCFEPRERDGDGGQRQAPARQSAPASGGGMDMNDDIPFAPYAARGASYAF